VGCSLQNFDNLGSGAGELVAGGAAGVAGTTDMGGTGGAAGGASAGTTGIGGGGVGGTATRPPEAGGGPNGGTGGGLPPIGSGGTSVGDGGPGESVNLFEDPSFEAGHSDWAGFGNSDISDVSDRAHTGTHCIGSIDRTETWEGPSFRIESVVSAGASYQASVWAWSEVSPTLSLSLKQVCSGDTATYTTIATASAASTWVKLQGNFTVPSCTLSELRLYIEGPAAEEDFYVDDVSLSLAP
jgi:hypothetical protein